MKRRFVTHPKQNVTCLASSGVPTFSIVVIDTNEVIHSTLNMSKAVMHAIHHTEATGQDTQVVKVTGPGEEQVVWTSVDNMPEYTKVNASEGNPAFEVSKEFKNNVLDALWDDFAIECTAFINNLSVIFKLPTGDLYSIDVSTIKQADADDTFDDLVDETAIHINNMCP